MQVVNFYKSQINSDERFISYIPIDVLINRLKCSNSKEINDFRIWISRGVYRDKKLMTYFKEEKNYIEDLINKLKELYNSKYFNDKILENNIKS